MLIPTTPSKLRPTHLERQAFIYVRQSTLFQVREHTASTARQYDLAQRAHDLGWPREYITIIDPGSRATRVPPRLAGMASSPCWWRSAWAMLAPSSVWRSPAWPAPQAIGIGCSKSVL